MLDTDARDAPGFSRVDEARGRDLQFYGMAVAQYQDFYIGMANLLNESTGQMDVRLVTSFDLPLWWKSSVNLGNLAGKNVRLRIAARNLVLYAVDVADTT
ncbi:MAG: hypothetical protein ABGX16_01835 [Pirellulales bacterium]